MVYYSRYKDYIKDDNEELYELEEFGKKDLISKGIEDIIEFLEELKWEIVELKLTEPEKYEKRIGKYIAPILDYFENKTFDNFLSYINEMNESYSNLTNFIHFFQMESIKRELKEISLNTSTSKILGELKKYKKGFISGFLISFLENEYLIKTYINPNCPKIKINNVYNEIESNLLKLFETFELNYFNYEILLENVNEIDPNEFELKI